MMWPFKKKLPLHDLVKYEAMLIRMRNEGFKPMPMMLPIDTAGESYTADEWQRIEDNQTLANELWRRYSGQVTA